MRYIARLTSLTTHFFLNAFMKNPRSTLGIVFLTVFIDLIGFGIVLPLLPLYSRDFGASGFMVGGIMAIFSLMQFLFAPVWGRLSDRVGRRPIMLLSSAGACVSYLIFGIAPFFHGSTMLWVLLLSRALAGVFGASITVAQACIADVSTPEKRSKSMALIGVAFGLGFIFGPVIGGFSLAHLGLSGPGWVAAAFCAANFIGAFFWLPETRTARSEHVKQRPHFAQWMHTLGHPQIGLLIAVFFLSTFSFSCFETTLGLLVAKNFHLDFRTASGAKTIAYLFAYCGIIGVFVQGGIGRLVKKMGEPRLIALSLFIVAVALGPIAFWHRWWELLIALALLAIGSGLTRAPVFGMISNLAGAHEQGATIGVSQGMGSLARIVGPIFAASLFFIHVSLPYVISGALCLLTGLLVVRFVTEVGQPVVPDIDVEEMPEA